MSNTPAADTVRARAPREVSFDPLPSAPGEPRRLIVGLKQSGSRPPLFVVPGQFGEAFQFTRLARRLREDIPFYSFEARGLWGDVEPHTSFQDAAAAYIAEMRAVQPHGPYFLGGFSMGGMAAWEMLQRLNDDGEQVNLILFDMGPEIFVSEEERNQRPRKNLWQRATHPARVTTFHTRNAFGLEGARRKAYLRKVFRQEVRRFGRAIGLDDDNFLTRMTLNAGRTPPPGHMAVRGGTRGARNRWEWEPYHEQFTLLRAHIQNPGRGIGPTLGFTPEIAAGGVDIRHVPGQHEFIFAEPHVFSVIAEIEAWIDRLPTGERPAAADSSQQPIPMSGWAAEPQTSAR
jgi:thioesterase domain-containing protein